MTSPDDFMPRWEGTDEEPKRQTVEEMKQILMGLSKVDFGDIRKRKIQKRRT